MSQLCNTCSNCQNDNRYLFVACAKGHVECVELLLSKSHQNDINYQNEYGNTPLMVACQGGHLNCVKLLLAENNIHNVNIYYQNKNGDTALIESIYYQHYKCAKFLCEQSGQFVNDYVNCKNKNNTTALIWAVTRGNIKCVKLLVEYGADINHTDAFGASALIWSKRYKHQECIDYLELISEQGHNLGPKFALKLN